jgi:hypothetical protein
VGLNLGRDAVCRTRRGWLAVRGVIACVALASVGICVAGPAGAQAGAVETFGHAAGYGSPTASRLSGPVAGMASTADGRGYWLVGADGVVFSFGDAGFYGSEGGKGVMTPFVGIAPTRDGHGYWIAGDFGNVYNFGDAPSEDPFAGRLSAPVVGIASDPKATGYWLVAADGGVFSFGHAAFHGSMGNVRLNAPMVGIAATPDGHGYWLVAADGGVFSFGDAVFHGSMGNQPSNPRTPVVAIVTARHGGGYWLATTVKPLPPATPVPSVLGECNEPAPAPSVKPISIVLACADANASLTHLSWTSWTTTDATATGVFTYNDCIPYCALGKFISVPARVQLSYPIETSAGKEFATISYSYTNPSPPGGVLTFTVVAATSPG